MGEWPFGAQIPDDVIDDGADAWPDDVAREVLTAAEVTPALLAKLIASVSEEEWCATWLHGVERIALHGWAGVRAAHDHPDVVAAFAEIFVGGGFQCFDRAGHRFRQGVFGVDPVGGDVFDHVFGYQRVFQDQQVGFDQAGVGFSQQFQNFLLGGDDISRG
jgi:hypothetical protein